MHSWISTTSAALFQGGLIVISDVYVQIGGNTIKPTLPPSLQDLQLQPLLWQ